MRKLLFFLSALLTAPLCSGADAYPNKPIRIIVATEPGSGTDIIARTIARPLSEQVGQSFVVQNRAGGTGIIGNELVAKSTPDGYTLLMGEPSFTIVPSLKKSMPYDVVKDFAPVTEIMRNPSALVVNSALKVNSVKELIALAQANPGKYDFGSAGNGSNSHMNSELFKIQAKVNIMHVPYKGGSGAVAALLGNEVHMMIAGIPGLLPSINSGKLRALAVTTDGARWNSLPDVPSMSEAGIPGMALYTWYGLLAPAKIPKDVLNKLHAETLRALAVPSVKDGIIAGGSEVVGNSPQEFASFLRAEIQRWTDVVKSTGISVD